ncbi:MAG: WD40/YVTN/BNR-like repeat-containing protein [Acidimicrobiales bacterium]
MVQHSAHGAHRWPGTRPGRLGDTRDEPTGLFTTDPGPGPAHRPATAVAVAAATTSLAPALSSSTTPAPRAVTSSVRLAWRALGPAQIGSGLPGAGKVAALAVDPADPQILYTGSGVGSGFQGPFGEGGAFASTTGGTTWRRVDTGLSDPMVDALWISPRQPRVVVAGTWSAGIFRSTNAGATWHRVYATSQVTSLVGSGPWLYAATVSGVVASANTGVTWTPIASTPSPVGALGASGPALYAGLDSGEILVRSSGSSPWRVAYRPPSAQMVWSMAADPLRPNVAYAVEWSIGSATTVLATTTGGATWTPLTLGPSCGYRAQAIGTGPGVLAVAGEGGSCVSHDGGATWTALGGGWDNRVVVVGPGATYWLGSDQGLYVTHDGGATWLSANGGVDSSLDTSVAVAGSTILVGVQDYSALASFDGGATWASLASTGEDGVVAFNPATPTEALACTSGGLVVSRDGGHTFRPAAGLPAGPCDSAIVGATGQLAFDPGSPSTLFLTSSLGVDESTDGGLTWRRTGWPSGAQAVAVDPTNPRHILVSTCCQSTAIWATTDGGISWHATSGPPTGGPVATLAFDPRDPRIVLAGSNTPPGGGGGIWRSIDGGATWSLDNAGIGAGINTLYGFTSQVAFAPGSSVAAAATSAGLYLSSNGSPWVRAQSGITPSLVTGVTWAPGRIVVSTFGEGVLAAPWRPSQLAAALAAPTGPPGEARSPRRYAAGAPVAAPPRLRPEAARSCPSRCAWRTGSRR